MCLLVILFTLFYFLVQAQQSLVYVNTSRGPVVGNHANFSSDTNQLYYGQADVFLGIPFVETPKRFEKPVKLTKFPGQFPYNATFLRPACPQDVIFPTSEDCLYLNIFTPKANASKKYPVMIWIHGGAYTSGSAWEYPINGGVRNLVSRGVVLVVIQYRLGLLGFFSTNTTDFPPNLGLLDQIEAIKFVREEISNFGGDPNQITLFGESAGSQSISAMSYSPLSQDLFQKGILESTAIYEGLAGYLYVPGDVKSSFYYNPQFEKFCNFTLDQWETGNYGLLKECLLKINISEFVVDDLYQYVIFVDGYLLPDTPDNLWKTRPNISILIGSNKDEAMLDYIESILSTQLTFSNITRKYVETYFEILLNLFPEQAQNLTYDLISDVYVKHGIQDDDHLEWLKIWDNFMTGAHIGSIAKDLNYWLWSGNPSVYLYEFTYESKIGFMQYWNITEWSPVPHGLELFYIWMDWQQDGTWLNATKTGVVNKTDFDLLDFFGESWTNFAKFGVPQPDWTPVNLDDYNYMEIDAVRQMKNGYRLRDRIFWNKVVPNMYENRGLFNPMDNSHKSNFAHRNVINYLSFFLMCLLRYL